MADRRTVLKLLIGAVFAPQTTNGDSESCPLGHQQKPNRLYDVPANIPQYNSAQQMLMTYQGKWWETHACAICGIVYVKERQEKP